MKGSNERTPLKMRSLEEWTAYLKPTKPKPKSYALTPNINLIKAKKQPKELPKQYELPIKTDKKRISKEEFMKNYKVKPKKYDVANMTEDEFKKLIFKEEPKNYRNKRKNKKNSVVLKATIQ